MKLFLILAVAGAPAQEGPRPTVRDVAPIVLSGGCADSVRDVTTGGCVTVDSTPAPGRLYPLGPLFDIDPAGDIEVSATAALLKGGLPFLHDRGVLGNTALGLQALALASITTGFDNTATGYRTLFSNTSGHHNTAVGERALLSNTLGLGNTALGSRALLSNTTGNRNTATGYRALYSNTTGFSNTAAGHQALSSNTTGRNNTASGYRALFSNTDGRYNTATGWRALSSNTEGDLNTAMGFQALLSNATGVQNTACGYRALLSNTASNGVAIGAQALEGNTTGSFNTAVGYRALESNTTGLGNIALGTHAGLSLTTGDRNITIGHSGVAGVEETIWIGQGQERFFVAGVRGVTTGYADAVSVLVDSNGQLGTASSSRRFKQDVRDMGDATERLLALRPVVFRYRRHVEEHGDATPFEYGLIAEEVAEVFPELVVHDAEGRPSTVKYRLLSSMLLNELQKAYERLEAHEKRLEDLEAHRDR